MDTLDNTCVLCLKPCEMPARTISLRDERGREHEARLCETCGPTWDGSRHAIIALAPRAVSNLHTLLGKDC